MCDEKTNVVEALLMYRKEPVMASEQRWGLNLRTKAPRLGAPAVKERPRRYPVPQGSGTKPKMTAAELIAFGELWYPGGLHVQIEGGIGNRVFTAARA